MIHLLSYRISRLVWEVGLIYIDQHKNQITQFFSVLSHINTVEDYSTNQFEITSSNKTQ